LSLLASDKAGEARYGARPIRKVIARWKIADLALRLA
jgi:hypothetical protein